MNIHRISIITAFLCHLRPVKPNKTDLKNVILWIFIPFNNGLHAITQVFLLYYKFFVISYLIVEKLNMAKFRQNKENTYIVV